MTTGASGRRATAADGDVHQSASRLLFARSLFLPADLGGNRYPYETVRRFGARGHPVTVATPRLHGRFPDLPNVRYRLYAVNRRHPALTHASNLAGATLALRAERREPYAAAMAGSYDAALALGWAGIAPHTPLVFLFHSQFYSEWVEGIGQGWRGYAHRAIRAYMGAVERRVFTLSARLIAVSQFSAQQMRERAPWAADKIRVVPTGVDTSYFAPPEDRAEAKRALGYAPDEMLVLGVGRLVGVKQFDRLVEAFALARRSGAPVQHLVLAGDGPERPRLLALAGRLGVASCVELPGFCDPPRLRALMQAADLQVCSSKFENFSLAILEALASGLPVVGTPGGGTPELVGAVDPSLVLADDSPGTMAQAIGRLASDPAGLQSLRRRARILASERYDWDRVVDQLESVCREVSPEWK